MPTIQISSANSKWFLFTGSHEARHQLDLLHLDHQLLAAGWQRSNIHHFIESVPFADTEYQRSGLNISTIANGNLLTTIQSAHTEVAIIVFSGHGDHDGVSYNAARSCLKGFEIVQAIQTATHIQSAIIINGACHAGAFNFLDVASGKPICVIGATNFELSFSLGIKSVPNFFEPSFEANLFLRLLSNWIINKADVDGDGQFTLADAFRWSAIRTLSQLQIVQASNFKEMTQKIDEEKTKANKAKADIKQTEELIVKYQRQLTDLAVGGHGPGSVKYENKKADIDRANNRLPKLKQDYTSADTSFKSFASLAFSRQEPWILNANQARLFQF